MVLQPLEYLVELLKRIQYMNDLVSIIMPSYNSEQYIKASIQSVLSQSYSNYELIIVDDCSKDKTVEIIKSFNDSRIKLYINEKNGGAAISRNRALKEARGKWIAFLDSDDIWVPDKLEKQIKFMESNSYDMTYSDYRIYNKGIWEDVIRTSPNKMTLRKLYNYCYFSTITVIYNKDVVGLVEIADLKKNNDYAMWFQVLEKTDGFRFPECLAYYIKHENSVSSENKLRLIKYHYIMFRKGLKKGKFVSFILTINNLFHGALKKIVYKEKVGEKENVALPKID